MIYKIIFIIFTLLFGGSYLYSKEDQNTSNIVIENNYKNEKKLFIEKKEWTTFVSDENINGPIRTILNNITSWIKSISTKNMLFGFFAFLSVHIFFIPIFWLISHP